MPAHLLAFSSSLGASTQYQQLNAVADQLYTRQNNEFQIPKESWVAWAAANGNALSAARIFTASQRLRGNPIIYPFDATTFDPTMPAYLDQSDDPIMLRMEENLRAEALHTPVGPDICRAFISIQQTPFTRNQNYKGGRWVRATSSIVAVAEGWSSLGSLTFDDILEGGSYAVYGMVAVGSTLIASRLVFQNQYERPGSLATVAVTNNPLRNVWTTNLGLWGVFDTYSPPQLEGFATSGGNISPVVFIYVAKADGFQPPFRGQTGV